MNSLVHTLPAHLLTSTTFTRFTGYFADDGYYKTKSEMLQALCFVEPITKTATRETGGIGADPTIYVHSPIELHTGETNMRDVVYWQGDVYAIIHLDGWPDYGYWCALAQKEKPPAFNFPTLNDKIRQLIHTTLEIDPFLVRPAYQIAPQSEDGFITVEIAPLTHERGVLQYDEEQEIITSTAAWRARIVFHNCDDAETLAHQLLRLWEGSVAQTWFDKLDIGPIATHPITQNGTHNQIGLMFDFTAANTCAVPLPSLDKATYQMIYDKE